MKKKYFIILPLICVLLFCGCDVDTGELESVLSDTVDRAGEVVTDTVDSVTLDEPRNVDSISGDRLVYRQLSGEEKVCYDQMLDCFMNFDESVTLSTSDEATISKAFDAIFADYGEIFWLDGYSYKTYLRGDKPVGTILSPNYTMTVEERDNYQARVEEIALDWLAGLEADADDYTKSKYIYETLIDRVDYDTSAPNNQNILSVFIGGATVCRGYAEATSYLLWRVGIPSMIISGTANGESHAWNLVKLDGEYYFIDTTWGNSRYSNETSSNVKHVNYAYLNVTSEEISINHVAQMNFTIPECTATKDNYYYHENLYFDTMDKDGIGKVFAKGYMSSDDTSSVKLSGSSLYNDVKNYFVDEQHIRDYCPGITSFAYIDSRETCVLTIEWSR